MRPVHVAVAAAAAAFLYLPIVVLAAFSFNDSALMAFPLSGFTWRWYGDLLDAEAYQDAILTSFAIAVPVGLLSALLGLLAALALVAAGPRLRLALGLCVLLPFLAPKAVLAISQAMILTQMGLPRGPVVLVLSQGLVALPFTTALLAAAALRLDPALDEAARDLGASPWASFRRVQLPLLRGTLGACVSVGMILSLADLTLATYLSGRAQPLARVVASEFLRELRPDVNAVQVVLLGLTALVVLAGAALRRLSARSGPSRSSPP